MGSNFETAVYETNIAVQRDFMNRMGQAIHYKSEEKNNIVLLKVWDQPVQKTDNILFTNSRIYM